MCKYHYSLFAIRFDFRIFTVNLLFNPWFPQKPCYSSATLATVGCIVCEPINSLKLAAAMTFKSRRIKTNLGFLKF